MHHKHATEIIFDNNLKANLKSHKVSVEGTIAMPTSGLTCKNYVTPTPLYSSGLNWSSGELGELWMAGRLIKSAE